MIFWFFSFVFAASLGAFIRYGLLISFDNHWSTLIVNFFGSLLIGFLAVLFNEYLPQIKSVILVAFLGSLTTFSSYAFDFVKIADQGLWEQAFLYIFLSNILCFGACYLGYKAGLWII